MTRNRRSFIIRIWRTETGLHGQLSDPQEGWRRPFRDGNALWRMLLAYTAHLSPDEESNDQTPRTGPDSQEEE